MITGAAIKRKSDGKIWTGSRHKYIYNEIALEEFPVVIERENFIEGFMTEKNEFVNRSEAFVIAVASRQIAEKKDGWTTSDLISEDLY